MAAVTYLQAVNQALYEEMRRDDNVVIFGEDVGELGGAFKATDGLHAAFGRDRVVDTPISESLLVGAGVGAAAAGLRPVVEMQFMDFVSCGFDQVVNMAATLRYRHGGGAHCPLVVRGPAGSGVHGGLFHSQNSEAWFMHTPGLKVAVPATPSDAKGLLKTAIRDDDPVLFFEHKRLYRSLKEELPEGDHLVPFGRAVRRRRGRDLLMVTYGGSVGSCMEAAEALAADGGPETEVLDLRTLVPLDLEAILDGVARINKVMVVHEAHRRAGPGAEIAAEIAEHAFGDLDGPVVRVCAADVPYAFSPPLEEFILPGTDKIVSAARKLLEY